VSQWLVSHLPSWLLLMGLVVLITAAALLLQVFVRRRFPNLRGDEHNDVTKFAFGVVGFVFAFFIGFVVSAMWGQINDADGRARTEGAAGVELARSYTVFDGRIATGSAEHLGLRERRGHRMERGRQWPSLS
jgi:cytochrome bd-type quinol oxidase subunit 2